MRTVALAALLVAIATSPTAAAVQAEVCRPTRPEQPVNNEDNNPGLGSALGLNDDMADVHPFGRNLSTFLIVPLAQEGSPGSASYVGTQTGNDCARTDEDDE